LYALLSSIGNRPNNPHTHTRSGLELKLMPLMMSFLQIGCAGGKILKIDTRNLPLPEQDTYSLNIKPEVIVDSDDTDIGLLCRVADQQICYSDNTGFLHFYDLNALRKIRSFSVCAIAGMSYEFTCCLLW